MMKLSVKLPLDILTSLTPSPTPSGTYYTHNITWCILACVCAPGYNVGIVYTGCTKTNVRGFGVNNFVVFKARRFKTIQIDKYDYIN